MITYITVKHQFVGYHHWPQAPLEVQFLRSLHRHVFHVLVDVWVSESRQVEFFLCQKDIVKLRMQNWLIKHPTSSCEQIAAEIARRLNKKYKIFRVTVSEDDENSATVILTESYPEGDN